MSSRNGARVEVSDQVILDGRLALFHRQQRWLAVADLHFGFELSQRAAGNLFPLWGMQTIQTRLEELLNEYQPATLVLLGDLVHDRSASIPFATFVEELKTVTDVVLISGNHDRHFAKQAGAVPEWQHGTFCFHHGHCELKRANSTQVIGHHHPAQVMRDGAGLRLKLPAFVQQDHCWIMPAFSPWAAGTVWSGDDQARIWLCSPNRIIQMATCSG